MFIRYAGINLLKQVSWFSSHCAEELKVPVSIKRYFSTPAAQKNHMQGPGSYLRDSDLNGLGGGPSICIPKSNSNIHSRIKTHPQLSEKP